MPHWLRAPCHWASRRRAAVSAPMDADQLLWLRQDMRDPDLNRLARARFDLLRQAIAARTPPLPVDAETAARLLEAQWQGALNQWGIYRQGSLVDYVTRSLAAWFTLA